MTKNDTQAEVEEKRYPYAEAYAIASAVLEQLRPHCIRIEIAGSIRRKRPEVKDIEIMAIPKPYGVGLFESGIASVVNQWEKVKGVLPCKYTQRILPGGIKLDLFLVEEENWGHQLAVRTGSAQYSRGVLARSWVRRGFTSKGGYLYRDGEKYGAREETDLFKLIGLRYVLPEARNL